MFRYYLLIYCVLAGGAISCNSKQDPQLYEHEEELSGGVNFTTFDFSENAFGTQGKNLTAEESNQFITGNSLFRSNWVTAPASVQSLDGLGLVFNATSCGSCHFKDGRAAPPQIPNEPLRGLLFRLGTNNLAGLNTDDPNYGGQFQDKAVLGVLPEGDVEVIYEEIEGKYTDGSSYYLRKPTYHFKNLNYGSFDPQIKISPRIAQQMPGLGLLENIHEQDILAWADENDTNQDGISGKTNRVWNVKTKQWQIGRFGWKANVPTLLQQTAGAFHGDIGITSSLFPKEDLTASQAALYSSVPNGGSPEISDTALEKVVLYVQTLAVPARRNWKEANILKGKELFKQLECSKCHRDKYTTAADSPIAALNQQIIRPYTDLLLHDMGEGLADGKFDFEANGQEWRTPPLWGLGLIETVNNHTFLLHDGRARNIEEAILWHGGEAENSKNKFINLSKIQRNYLIDFIKSL